MTDIGMTTEDSAALREHVDAALHQWWNDDHDDGSSHHCRPVPTEDEFLAALSSQGFTIVRSSELEDQRRTHDRWVDTVYGGDASESILLYRETYETLIAELERLRAVEAAALRSALGSVSGSTE